MLSDSELLGLFSVLGKLGTAVKALESQLAQERATNDQLRADLDALRRGEKP